MKYIDTHCHLNDEALIFKADGLIERAANNGVAHIFVVGYDMPSSRKALDIAEKHENIFAIVGIHPTEAVKTHEADLIKLEEMLGHPKVIGVGETGLDYYWQKEEADHEIQRRLFIRHIELADKYDLPVSVHCRDAHEDTLKILQDHPPARHGVMHCYAGPSNMVIDYVKAGMYLSFAGPITFRKADDSRLALSLTPVGRLLFETDSPYLAPVPNRGKENEPANVVYTYQKAAEILNIDISMLEEKIKDNAETLFHVKLK